MSMQNNGRRFNPRQKEESLLRHLDFVAKSRSASFEPGRDDWKAGALPTELPPHFRSYFNPKNQLCQRGSPCFVKNGATELANLAGGYALCARADGKSKLTIQAVTSSVRYLERFLDSEGLPTDVTQIWAGEIRAFIIYLQRKRCFSEHPCSRPQEKVLSSHSVNSYMRSIRAFWSWLIAEGIVDRTPFSVVKVPKAQKKVVNTFSGKQLEALLAAIDVSTAEGFRDYTLVLTLLDQ